MLGAQYSVNCFKLWNGEIKQLDYVYVMLINSIILLAKSTLMIMFTDIYLMPRLVSGS